MLSPVVKRVSGPKGTRHQVDRFRKLLLERQQALVARTLDVDDREATPNTTHQNKADRTD